MPSRKVLKGTTKTNRCYDGKKPKASGESIDLEALGQRLKAAVAAGKMTEKEAIAKYKEAAAGAAGKKPRRGPKSPSFGNWDRHPWSRS